MLPIFFNWKQRNYSAPILIKSQRSVYEKKKEKIFLNVFILISSLLLSLSILINLRLMPMRTLNLNNYLAPNTISVRSSERGFSGVKTRYRLIWSRDRCDPDRSISRWFGAFQSARGGGGTGSFNSGGSSTRVPEKEKSDVSEHRTFNSLPL